MTRKAQKTKKQAKELIDLIRLIDWWKKRYQAPKTPTKRKKRK